MIRCILILALYVTTNGLSAAASPSDSELLSSSGAVRLDSAGQNACAPVLPEGAPLTVVLKETLKGGSAAVGKTVAFAVASDVLAPNGRDVILKAGTPAYGTVRESGGAGMFGKGGKLKITCDYVVGADGTQIPLRPAAKHRSPQANGTSWAPAAILTGVVVFVPTWFVAELSTGLNCGSSGCSSNGAGPIPFLAGVSLGTLAAAGWRGGSATLREGRIFNVEVAASTPLVPSASKVGSR